MVGSRLRSVQGPSNNNHSAALSDSFRRVVILGSRRLYSLHPGRKIVLNLGPPPPNTGMRRRTLLTVHGTDHLVVGVVVMPRAGIEEFLVPPAPAAPVDPFGHVQAVLQLQQVQADVTVSALLNSILGHRDDRDSVTHGNDAQIGRGISFHDELVGRVLGTQRPDLNVLGDPFFGDERLVRSIEDVADITRDACPSTAPRVHSSATHRVCPMSVRHCVSRRRV